MQIGEENGVKKLNCKLLQVDVSDKPKVELRSCNSQSLLLNIETTSPVSFYSINWGDGSTVDNINYQTTGVNATHTYTTSPANVIEVQAVYRNTIVNKTCSSKPVKISPPPMFYIRSLESQDFGSTLSSSLQVNNPNNETIEVLFSVDGGLSYNNSISTKQNQVDIDGLPKTSSCYKVKYTKNSCVYTSEPVCSIYPIADNTLYGEINVSWNPIGIQTTYIVKRYGGTSLTETTNQSNYTDKKLDCSGNYNYQISANYKNTLSMPVEVLSSFARSNANFTPALQAKQGLVVTVNSDNRPQLNILDDTGTLRYYIYRSKGSSLQNFTKIDKIVGSQYIDGVDASKDKYCYMITYEDVCKNISPATSPFCTIFLEANGEDLFWNPPSKSSTIQINYDLNRIIPPISTINQINTSFSVNNPVALIEKYQVEGNLKLIIAGKEYNVKSKSNQLELNFRTPVYLPNSFSPNGDNINDIFGAFGRLNDLKSLKMQIFNRWGEIIYESTDWTRGWDGRIDGEIAISDIYIYTITYTDRFGNSFSKKGSLTILNN